MVKSNNTIGIYINLPFSRLLFGVRVIVYDSVLQCSGFTACLFKVKQLIRCLSFKPGNARLEEEHEK